MNNEDNTMRDMITSSYNDNKLDKQEELNASMSINEQSRDQYESSIWNAGGAGNGE